MSSVIVIAPILIASWPALSAAIAGVVGTMGFSIVKAREEQVPHSITGPERVEVEVADSEVLQDAVGGGDEMVVQRGDVTVKFGRDARGALRLCLEGSLTKRQLRKLGEELMGRVTQQFVYNKVMTELRERGLPVLEEQVLPDQSVKIRVRAW
ncbi:MAG: hypothetical protein HY000_26405 [Planctomycetes bacterium]|nr:hypothetical protein [Planctomycetota bacterium]